MALVTENIKKEVRDIVFDFFVEECEVDISEISDDTNVLSDIEGDSLMFLELLEIFKKKYKLDVELKTIGKYVVKHPVETIKQIIEMTFLIIKHENKISELD